MSVIVRDLIFAYTPEEPILQGVSFTLNPGDRVALLGSTGAGKSTLLEHLLGLKEPQSGQIWIAEIPLKPETLAQVRQKIGFGFQDPADQLFMPTLLEDITFGPLNYGVSRSVATAKARSLLAEFGLEKFAHRPAHQLSGGQKRLASLAAILALEPKILILDEPTAGLDPLWRCHLANILQNLPVDVLLIASHDLQWIGRVTTRSLILAKGQIQVDNDTQFLLQNPKILENYGLPLFC